MQLYQEWKKQNKRFVRFGRFKEGTLEEARESFLYYLRTNNVSLANVDIELDTFPFYWDFCQFIIASIPSFIAGNALGKNDVATSITIPVAIGTSIICYILLKLIVKIAQNTSKGIALSEYNFVRLVLKRFKELYSDDLYNGNKVVQIRGNNMVSIPLNAVKIYGEKMRQAEYYYNVFYVVMSDNQQDFPYVWYSNKNYNSWNHTVRNDFFRLCKDQIGENWSNVSAHKISFNKLPIINNK